MITDRKLYVSGTYTAVVISNSDYYPFGMTMPGRNTNISSYRFGYNGMEMDNETKGNGNSYTTEFRQYDPRLGRWLSLDPLMMDIPDISPYVAFDDNPVLLIDPEGLKAREKDKDGDPDLYTYKDGKKTKVGAFKTWWIKNQNRNVKEAVESAKKNDGSVVVNKTNKGWSAVVKFAVDDPEEKNGVIVKNIIFNPIEYKSNRGQYDGTVIAMLPWYQIGRGIQDVQAGDNWGWVKIAAEVVPLELLGRLRYIGHLVKINQIENAASKIGPIMDEVISNVAKLPKKQQKKISTIVIGINRKTGEVAIGMKNAKENFGKCAEDIVVEKLGCRKKDVVFSKAYRPRTGENIRVCKRCQSSYSKEQFIKGTEFE